MRYEPIAQRALIFYRDTHQDALPPKRAARPTQWRHT